MISVIIASYNEEKCIEGTIRSVLMRSVEEVIVVDDNSQDRTVDIIESIDDPRVQVIIKPSDIPQGKNDSIRIGAEAAKSDNLIIIDADVRVRDISNMIIALEEGADLVGGIVSIKEDDRYISHLEAIEYKLSIEQARPWLWRRGYLNNVSGAFFGIKKNLLLNNPIPDLMGEDMYLTQIAHKEGWNIQLVDSEVVTLPIPSIKALIVQRARWTMGWGQVIRATGRKTPLLEAVPVSYRLLATIAGVIGLDFLTGNFWLSTIAVLAIYYIIELLRVKNPKDALAMMAYRQLNFIAAILSPIIGRSWTVNR